jgi:ribosomal protein S18 acetylase RimI-like enzyme
MNDDSLVMRRLSRTDSALVFQQVAALHREQIQGGVLPLLGEDFLTTLYRELADAECGTVYQATLDGRPVGFIAGTTDIWRCAFGFTLRGYLRLAWILARRIWHPDIARKFLDAVAYPFRPSTTPEFDQTRPDKQRAELLAIAVASEAQGQGVGRSLVSAFERTLRGRTTSYCVTTNASDTRSNAFYEAAGFTKAGQKRHHDLTIQIYTKEIQPV